MSVQFIVVEGSTHESKGGVGVSHFATIWQLSGRVQVIKTGIVRVERAGVCLAAGVQTIDMATHQLVINAHNTDSACANLPKWKLGS